MTCAVQQIIHAHTFPFKLCLFNHHGNAETNGGLILFDHHGNTEITFSVGKFDVAVILVQSPLIIIAVTLLLGTTVTPTSATWKTNKHTGSPILSYRQIYRCITDIGNLQIALQNECNGKLTLHREPNMTYLQCSMIRTCYSYLNSLIWFSITSNCISCEAGITLISSFLADCRASRCWLPG